MSPDLKTGLSLAAGLSSNPRRSRCSVANAGARQALASKPGPGAIAGRPWFSLGPAVKVYHSVQTGAVCVLADKQQTNKHRGPGRAWRSCHQAWPRWSVVSFVVLICRSRSIIPAGKGQGGFPGRCFSLLAPVNWYDQKVAQVSSASDDEHIAANKIKLKFIRFNADYR